jgi:hypothetical protein
MYYFFPKFVKLKCIGMSELMKEIVSEIEEILGTDTGRLLEVGLLRPVDAKKWLVKQKYYSLAKTGMTYTDIKLDLSDKYGISVSSIEKMVYRK